IPLAASLFWPPALLAAAGMLLLYGTALLSATLLAACTAPGMHLLLFPMVLVTVHLSYGCGSLCGLATRSRSLVTRLLDSTARSSRPRRKSDWLRPVMVFGLAPGVFYFLL